MSALPAESLFCYACCFRFRANQRRITGTVGLTEGVPTSHERHGLLIVHRHACKSLSNVTARGDRIRVAVRAFRVHVDQAHLHGGQGVFEFAVTAVTALGLVACGQPFLFRAPVNVLFRLPDILAPAGETEGLESHRFQRTVAGEDHQVGPGDLVAVFLLDRPEQSARLVEVDVVRPTVEGSKALVAGPPTAAPVTHPVCTSAVPCHTDKEPAIMAVIRWPPIL